MVGLVGRWPDGNNARRGSRLGPMPVSECAGLYLSVSVVSRVNRCIYSVPFMNQRVKILGVYPCRVHHLKYHHFSFFVRGHPWPFLPSCLSILDALREAQKNEKWWCFKVGLAGPACDQHRKRGSTPREAGLPSVRQRISAVEHRKCKKGRVHHFKVISCRI